MKAKKRIYLYMCKSTCIYEKNEVFIGIFKQCVFTNFTFRRQAFYVNFNKLRKWFS